MKIVKRQRKNGMYYVKLVEKTGRVLLTSEDYSSKDGIDSLLEICKKYVSKEVEFEDRT